ncbi:LysR family transcriptional regulator [Pseudomonas sp. S75]|uniref:LysR family transcriptional regulator n=1 Tax=unclassified Pseudomonas TaxID=196821 RepID=UPI0019089C30|nr:MULTISPECIES: LysR family transcriptional regulator [unclassified Pseudomonas]MBJ9975725.1 LysR family transcriptional regulator [Pseudomonas sp. S30]MBK0154683.1 LysR family transcriptional regulator [Pseudomonas sp. S75]
MFDSLEELRFFAQVYASGSIRSAADSLGITPAGGSKRLQNLENRIGRRLFNRTTRQLSPTPYAEKFYPHVAAILASVEAAQHALGDSAEISGRIRLTSSATFAGQYLSDVISSYMRRYPAVSLELDLTDRVVDLVAEGVDLAIRYGALEDSTLIAQLIAPCRRLVCASPDYWRQHGLPDSPEDLKRHAALLIGGQDRWQFALGAQRQTVRVSGHFTSSMGEMVRQMALDGHGMALLADWHIAQDLRAGRLVEALPQWQVEPPIGLFAVYPSRDNQSPAVRCFIAHLKEQIEISPLVQ